MLTTPLEMKFDPVRGWGIKDADNNSVYSEMMVREFNALAARVEKLQAYKNAVEELINSHERNWIQTENNLHEILKKEK